MSNAKGKREDGGVATPKGLKTRACLGLTSERRQGRGPETPRSAAACRAGALVALGHNQALDSRQRSAAVRLAAALLLVGVGLAGCSSPGSDSPGGNPAPNRPNGRLAQFEDCDALLGAIQADARIKVAIQADQLRTQAFFVREEAGSPPIFFGPEPIPVDNGQPDEFTETNVQVAGVDEADAIETDGQRISLLQGNELVTLTAWPPSALAVESRLVIEGSPLGLFADGERAAVVSSVWDNGSLGGDDSCRGIGLPQPQPFMGDVAIGAPIACGTPFTKITMVDLVGTTPTATREVYVEGNLIAARRHNNAVRIISQRGWGLPIALPDPWATIWGTEAPVDEAAFKARVDAWEEEALAAVDASSLDGWLPTLGEPAPGGGLTGSSLSCGDVHIPAAGVGEDGSSTIVTLDLDDDASAIRSTLVLGGAGTTYASLDTLVLASPQWGAFQQGEETDRTALHFFALDGFETNYQASGFVAGQPLSSFALDARDGLLRIATTVTSTNDPDGTTNTASRITTLRPVGEGLETVGATPDLAPGERIFAVRFLGDLAYLVTFRQIDPLFVIDLADPEIPTVLGEVELPGFSEYIHPLGNGRLLTIGRDADETGATRGLALRLFDVSDPTAPRLDHVELLPGEGWSPAEGNHLAFTFDARLGLLALPFNNWQPNWTAALVLYSIDATSGIEQVGEILDPGPDSPECVASDVAICGGQTSMQRGLFIEDHVYAWSSSSLRVHALADLTEPVAIAPLPNPWGGGGEPVPVD